MQISRKFEVYLLAVFLLDAVLAVLLPCKCRATYCSCFNSISRLATDCLCICFCLEILDLRSLIFASWKVSPSSFSLQISSISVTIIQSLALRPCVGQTEIGVGESCNFPSSFHRPLDSHTINWGWKFRPANNYFTWKDKCLAKPKISRIFINFSRAMDCQKQSKVFHNLFSKLLYFLPGHVSLHCNATKTEYIYYSSGYT